MPFAEVNLSTSSVEYEFRGEYSSEYPKFDHVSSASTRQCDKDPAFANSLPTSGFVVFPDIAPYSVAPWSWLLYLSLCERLPFRTWAGTE